MNLGIRELAERAKKEGAVDLAQGIIHAKPPAVLVDLFHRLPIEQYSNYSNKRGVLEFRQAIQQYLISRGWPISYDHIIGTAGVIGAITAALLTHARPGDKVLLLEPFFIGHKLLLEALGFEVVFYKVPLDQAPDWTAIAQQFSQVKAALITSPANPTGQYLTAKQRDDLCKAAAQQKCLLILDEVYRDFIWSEIKPSDTDYTKLDLSYTVITRSFSKTLAISGWRVGFAVTTPERVEDMANRHDAIYLGSSTIAQYALTNIIREHTKEINHYIHNLRQFCEENRQLLAEIFADYGMKPLPVFSSYYMLIQHNRPSDMAAMEELMKKKVVVTPANILFSDPSQDTGYIRIHFAVARKAIEMVKESLSLQ